MRDAADEREDHGQLDQEHARERGARRRHEDVARAQPRRGVGLPECLELEHRLLGHARRAALLVVDAHVQRLDRHLRVAPRAALQRAPPLAQRAHHRDVVARLARVDQVVLRARAATLSAQC